MSTLVSKNVQIGADGTASNNFTAYQPAAPDGTLRIGNGNSGSVTDAITLTSAGNVGIGTTSPGAKLDVRGSSTFLVNATNPTAWTSVDSGLTTGSMYNQFNTTSNIGISGTYTNHPYTFVTNNTERMRIDSNGNVGIGISPPTGKLQVVGIGGSELIIGYAGASTNYIDADTQIFRNGSKTETMRITSTGNVGIGTSSPSALLDLEGATATQHINATTGNANTLYQLNGTTTASIEVGGGNNFFLTNNNASGNIYFRTGAGAPTRATIDSSGNFQFNSGYGSAATAYGCRAWVNFNGTGTVAIRASGNVSSITDNSTGDYTVNFTTAMVDVNYTAVAASDSTNSNSPQGMVINFGTAINNKVSPTTSALRVSCWVLATGAGFDNPYINVAIFR
jgi:hypothetical protein